MFQSAEVYEGKSGNCWLITDSIKGRVKTGWYTIRPLPFVIIQKYANDWEISATPSLRNYYSSYGSFNLAMKSLERDLIYMKNESLADSNAFKSKYIPCIKNHLEKLLYTGKIAK